MPEAVAVHSIHSVPMLHAAETCTCALMLIGWPVGLDVGFVIPEVDDGSLKTLFCYFHDIPCGYSWSFVVRRMNPNILGDPS